MVETQTTKIKTDKFEISVVEKGIIENHILPHALIDVADIHEMKKYNVMLADNTPYTMLITSSHLSDTTNEARELTARKDFSPLVRARALLTKSTGHKIVANFYLKVNRPFVRTKLFSDKEKAIQWLRTFL